MKEPRISCRSTFEIEAELRRVGLIVDRDRSDLIRHALKVGIPIIEQRHGQTSRIFRDHAPQAKAMRAAKR